MIFGLSLAPIVDRLVERAPLLKKVAGVAEVDGTARAAALQTPAAFVEVIREQAAPHAGGSGRLVQTVNTSVGVAICIRNYTTSALGSGAVVSLESVRAEVRRALINWRHPDAQLVFDLESGRLLDYDAGTLWWQDTFRTRYLMTVNS